MFGCGLVFIVALGCLGLVFLGWGGTDSAVFGAGLLVGVDGVLVV